MTVTACWPRVSRCRWCAHPVLRDNDGAWIHAHLAYVCRDPSGGLAATTAEPEGTQAGSEGMRAGPERGVAAGGPR